MTEMRHTQDDQAQRADALRRSNRRAATIAGAIALGIFVYTLVRGFFR
ncbi:MAG: hypothetical protein ACYDHY_08395 [Acidiferrobacterales bacterium]